MTPTLLKNLRAAVILIPVLMALDIVWLGALMSHFYRSELGSMLRLRGESIDTVTWAAILVYLCIAAGILGFAAPRALAAKKSSRARVPMAALGWGFGFGLVLYGTYDFTNVAILSHWPITVALVDVAWGGVLCAVGTALSVRLLK